MTWMKAYNDTQNTPLLSRVRHCASFTCQLRGLMFRRTLDEQEGLVLIGQTENRLASAIHMFFVFFPIAAIWLDRQGRVVDAQLARPFRPVYLPQSAAKDVLEGSPTLLDKVKIGDHIRFEE